MAPEGKKFYGSVTVSERGQIAIPVEARKDFDIKPGQKLLVFGDMERGIGIATVSIIQKNMEGTMDFFQELGPQIDNKDDKKLKGRGKHK
ncbi:MAG: AbrB/MazE/SpoVT family DNA-binding domain-containing protein [Actinomycetota bacterium]|jgi:AbrB family looped-hinge helix DNA binding protein|nr:AbrB/MazE/SpoVT family DNA-binding domain-containing protein [Actinomycetota bacterium]